MLLFPGQEIFSCSSTKPFCSAVFILQLESLVTVIRFQLYIQAGRGVVETTTKVDTGDKASAPNLYRQLT